MWWVSRILAILVTVFGLAAIISFIAQWRKWPIEAHREWSARLASGLAIASGLLIAFFPSPVRYVGLFLLVFAFSQLLAVRLRFRE